MDRLQDDWHFHNELSQCQREPLGARTPVRIRSLLPTCFGSAYDTMGLAFVGAAQ